MQTLLNEQDELLIDSLSDSELRAAIFSKPSLWAETLKNEAAFPIDFEKRKYLVDMYNDMSPLQVVLKPPQIGATVMYTIKSFWVANFLRRQIIYTLPTQSDIQDMVGGSINRIIAQNQDLLDMVHDHDTVEQKSVGESIIFYRGCVDEQTEVLTEKGWRKFGFVDVGDRLPSLNLLTNTVEMDNVLDMSVFRLKANEQMVHIKSRQIDQMVTADHRCVVSKRTFVGNKSPLRIVRAHELVGKTTAYIPMKHNPIGMPYGEVGDVAFYKILGWVIGDGSYWTKRDKSGFVRKDGTVNPTVYETKKVCIIQSKFCEELESDLAIAGIGYHKKKHNGTCFRYELNAKASVAIREAIADKQLTYSLVFNATPFERKAIYDGLMMSDGNNYIQTRFYQNAGETVDAFQALLVLMGRTSSTSSTRKNVSVSIKTSDYAEVRAKYEYMGTGIAWCPTTRNGTIFIRRNGIVSVTGQTFTTKQAMMVPSGLNVHDEVDASNAEVITQYENRLQAQEDGGWRWYFSHPSLAGHGVDIYWERSDKKEWVITCECGKRQILTWPESIDQERECYQCKYCKAEITDYMRIHGRWLSTAVGEFSGYHVSQLMLYNKSARHIIDAFNDPTKNEQFFYNYVLGLPYVGSENKIPSSVVLKNVTPEINEQGDRIIIGVDTGLPIHYTCMNKQGAFFFGQCKPPSKDHDPYDELEALLKRWSTSIIMADQGGDLIGIRKLQAKYPGRVYLVFYRKDRKSKEMVKWGENEEQGTVVVDRNQYFQWMVEQLRDTGRVRLQGTVEEWEPWAKQFDNVYRELKVAIDKPGHDIATNYGAELIWKRNGADHFCHTLLYCMVGLDKYGSPSAQFIKRDARMILPKASRIDNTIRPQQVLGKRVQGYVDF